MLAWTEIKRFVSETFLENNFTAEFMWCIYIVNNLDIKIIYVYGVAIKKQDFQPCQKLIIFYFEWIWALLVKADDIK